MARVRAEVINQERFIPENTNPLVVVEKESKQREAEQAECYDLTPRYDFTGLSKLFELNTYHSRCCKAKAGITLLLGFNVIPADNCAEKESDDNYRRVEEFMRNSLYELYKMQLDEEVFGSGFAEIVRNNKREIAELYHIPTLESVLAYNKKRYELKQTLGGSIITYKEYEGKDYAKTDKNEFIHIKNYGVGSRHYGMPDYISAVPTMFLDNSAIEFNTKRFLNNAMPDTILTFYGFDGEDDNRDGSALKKDIADFFRNNYKGTDKAGKVLVLFAESAENNKIEVEKMTPEIKDASFRGLRQDNKEEIVSAHGVPPRVIGIEAGGKLSGGGEAKEQLNIFNEIVIIPRKRKIERVINDLLITGMGISDWKIQLSKFEYANVVDDASYYKAMVEIGALDASEVRSEAGYAPRPKV